MYDWNAPATLAYWPGQADLPEKACATLTDAIREADASDGRTPWIVTQNGGDPPSPGNRGAAA